MSMLVNKNCSEDGIRIAESTANPEGMEMNKNQVNLMWTIFHKNLSIIWAIHFQAFLTPNKYLDLIKDEDVFKSINPSDNNEYQEVRLTGNVKWSVFRVYFNGVAGLIFLIFIILLFMVTEIALIGTEYWGLYW